jgi:hypothetical protein
MLMTGSGHMDAERAFTRVSRSRRRAALARWLRRERRDGGQLPVHDEYALREAGASQTVREIPLGAISLFDCCFRPAASARARWQRIWLAEQRGAVLPPISVVAVGETYAIRDGHHRVSVARARGAAAIDALVDRAMPAAAPQT